MEVRLTPEQEAFIRQGIERGDYRNPEEALCEALGQWEDRRRAVAELRAAIEEADEDIAAGRIDEYDDTTLGQLADELKREARNLTDRNR